MPVRIAGEHGTIRYPLTWKWFYEPWIDRTSDLVIANSESSRRMLEQKYRVPSSRIQVIHDAVHVAAPGRPVQAMRAELGIPDGVNVIGNVARLDTPKDHFTLVETARILLNLRDDVRFLIVGGGPLEAELRGMIREYGLEDRFIITGWRRDIPDLLQMFDLFVSTSISEPLGNALIEAMFAGVPVIAPAVDGIPEIVSSGETGILLEPTDPVRPPRSVGAAPLPQQVIRSGRITTPLALNPRRLADTITHWLDQPDERAALAARAKQRVENHFSLERYMTELEDTYLRLAQAKVLLAGEVAR